jgi:arabinogalactan oligomer/maltooligosaccharide transport system substrate-binding protein
MKMSHGPRWLLLGLLFILVACRPAGSTTITDPEFSGEFIFWRVRGDEANEQAWQNMLARFEDIFQIRVIQSVYDAEEYRERIELTTDIGIGPDLFVAPHEWVTEMAQEGMIRPVPVDTFNLDVYLSGAIESLRHNDALYGVPVSLNNNALYYNTEMVEVPATTLDELLQQARNGAPAAITSTFDESFWGIQAFGGQIFDENNQIVIGKGGVANWLSWLQNAQDEPGMIVNTDKLALRDLFIDGTVAYYVGAPTELASMQTELGVEKVGVALLPSGPQGPAGPLLQVEALFFGPNSSVNQANLAYQLARFLTNNEQGTTLLRETGRVPANTRVQVDRRIYPKVGSFAVQARTAVALPNIPQSAMVRQLGDELYRGVLSGVITPADGVALLSSNLKGEEFVAAATPEPAPFDCGGPGIVTIWHSQSEYVGRALADVAFEFGSNCPQTTITVSYQPEDELLDRLANEAEDQPDILVVSHTMLPVLIETGQLIPVTGEIDDEIRQRYFARALHALSVDNEGYGFPFALEVNTLYRVIEQAPDAPVTLDDLLLQVNSEVPLAFPLTGRDAFWGITAHSNALFDEEGRFLSDPEGLVEWLIWLHENKTWPGNIFSADQPELRDQFGGGEAAFYVGRAGDYPFLLENLSADDIRTAALPSGPQGAGRPLLIVESFLFTPEAEDNLAAALAFVDYATSQGVQLALMSQERLLPANINVSMENFPNVAVLQAQAQEAVLMPYDFPYQFALAAADQMYVQVFDEQQEPAEAGCAYILAVNAEMGVELTLEDLGPVCNEDSE